MNQICKQCGTEYDAKRSSSMFCSAKCRKLAFQKDSVLSVPEVSVPEVAQTITSEQVRNAWDSLPPSGGMTPEGYVENLPTHYGEPDCECLHCIQNGGKKILNHGAYKHSADLAENEINRVSIPGDVDYCGCMPCQI